MSIKEKFTNTKNTIVSDLKENGKKYAIAFGVGLGIGALYVVKGLTKSHNDLVKVVNHNAKTVDYNRKHPLYIEKTNIDGMYDVKKLYFPTLDEPSAFEK